MDRIHRRFTAEQIRVLLLGYCQGALCRSEVEEMLHLGKTRFPALLKEYRRVPDRFGIDYHRPTRARPVAAIRHSCGASHHLA